MAKTKVLKAPYDPDGSLLHYPGDYHPFSHYEDIVTGGRLEREQIWEPLPEPIIGTMYTEIERLVRPMGSWRMVHREPEWRDNLPFHATFQIDSVRSGRSAKYVMLRPLHAPLDRRTWPMFVVDLIDVLNAQGVEPEGILSGRWMVAKRGQNYGLRLAKEGE